MLGALGVELTVACIQLSTAQHLIPWGDDFGLLVVFRAAFNAVWFVRQ